MESEWRAVVWLVLIRRLVTLDVSLKLVIHMKYCRVLLCLLFSFTSTTPLGGQLRAAAGPRAGLCLCSTDQQLPAPQPPVPADPANSTVSCPRGCRGPPCRPVRHY